MLWLLWLACGTDPAPPQVQDDPTPELPAPSQTSVSSDPTEPKRGDDGLVEAPGVELVRAHCAACHATKLVKSNHMSRERWDATLTWMQQTQGLWEIAPEQRSLILDYLAEWQGPERAADDAASSSPWASPLYEPNPIW